MTACCLTGGGVSCHFFAESSESIPPFFYTHHPKSCALAVKVELK